MLRVKKLRLINFGPYKDGQEIVFSEGNGVTVIFGENGQGKTSLLNAIKYAFFGRVTDRIGKELDKSLFLNWESRLAGMREFSVVLEFSLAGDEYELTRLGKLHTTNSDPVSAPVAEDIFLKVNGNPLSREATLSRVASIMPEQVSRFFLFDGELLKEYEELLGDETVSHRQIKQAIEKILGVPVLTNSIAHLKAGLKDAEKKETEAVRASRVADAIAAQLERLREEETALEGDLIKSEKDLLDLRNQKLSIESEMAQNEKVEKLIAKRDFLRNEIVSIEAELKSKQDLLVSSASSLWINIARERIHKRVTELEGERNRALVTVREAIQAQTHYGLVMNAATNAHCDVCQTALLPNKVASLGAVTPPVIGVSADEVARIFESVGVRVVKLREILDSTPAGAAAILAKTIKELKAKRVEKKMEFDEYQRNIGNVDDDIIRSLRPRRDKVMREIVIMENKVEDLRNQIDQKMRDAENVRSKIPKSGNAVQAAATARRELYEKLVGAFEAGLANYRDRLKHHVEKEATNLFRLISRKPGYDRLRISESYGLTIIHKDGREIPWRSAGFEHVVALSLMGALQKNAPLQGPVFMDSPMGRLDGKHKENLVKALPSMSPQVVFLVYNDEVDPRKVREYLGTSLLCEYELREVSECHTKIDRKVG